MNSKVIAMVRMSSHKMDDELDCVKVIGYYGWNVMGKMEIVGWIDEKYIN